MKFIYPSIALILLAPFANGAKSLALRHDASFVKDMRLLNANSGGQCQLESFDYSWHQVGNKIDGAAKDDHFGSSVSMSSDGKTVAIAAPDKDVNGKDSGHVRIYHWDCNSAWVQLGGDIDGENANDHFGYSVSLSNDGTTVAIGAKEYDINTVNSGAQAGYVQIYKYNSSAKEWIQLGSNIEGTKRLNWFGYSVSLSSNGNTVAIGGTGYGNAMTGDARVFNYDSSTADWIQHGSTLEGVKGGDDFGSSISLSDNGKILAVGATHADSPILDSGHVRIFEWDVSTADWKQRGATLDGAKRSDQFGYAVSLSGDGKIIAVGIPGEDQAGMHGVDYGVVRTFEWDGSAWNQHGTDMIGEKNGDRLGETVSLSNNGQVLAIGAKFNDASIQGQENQRGHARIFHWDSSASDWTQIGEDIDGTNSRGLLGASVSLSGDGKYVAIGASRVNLNGVSDVGQVQIMVYDCPNFPQCPSVPGPQCSSLSSSGGDPHFTTWNDEHYEYHGQCDLVMLNDPAFADGIGLDVHVRTKIVRHWSYIKNVAIKIGNDILEIEGSADADDAEAHYWYNFEYQGEMDDLNGFPVTQKLPSVYKRQYKIDLSSKFGPGKHIAVQLYKEFLRVTFDGDEAVFGKSVGLLGDYKTGKTVARDGITDMHDYSELGDEWQVLPSEPKLFHQISHPQFPEACIKPEDPRGERKRRLDESSISVEQAEAACAALKDPLSIKDCVYDVLATQDMGMVGAF